MGGAAVRRPYARWQRVCEGDQTRKQLQTPHGNYVAVGNHIIPPGNFCFFEQCSPAQITSTCAPVGKEDEATKSVQIVLKKKAEYEKK